MSTRATIFYKGDLHIYRETLDNTVHLEIESSESEPGVTRNYLIDLELMTMDEWQKLMKGEWKPEGSNEVPHG